MSALSELVAAELATPAEPEVQDIARAIAVKHGSASRAVLFYGSCLRERRFDGLMLDFYLIVSDYRSAYSQSWLAAANRLIPPNVFYFEHGGLRSKYSVLSEADLERECGPQARSISVLARFSQPSRLVWSADEAAEQQTVRSIARCAPTLLAKTVPLVDSDASAIAVWKRAFSLTYAAELRAERSERSSHIVDTDPERYERFANAALQDGMGPALNRLATPWWGYMQRKGRLLSLLRLAKASATFAGGADYLAWKINRHSNAGLELTPWQRRWPVVAAITLLPRLLKSGAVR
ncbi:MAG: hypothetical protein M3438_06035 [Pseudomonadota bacterium]|nr:hypothetical protein [Sphingomonas sp.]MDQ3478702.1 hypothetical protein [Pseudomonadota bacterium]